MTWRQEKSEEKQKMNDVKIEIKLNPLTDGIVQTICIDKAERQDQRALVIATNGDM